MNFLSENFFFLVIFLSDNFFYLIYHQQKQNVSHHHIPYIEVLSVKSEIKNLVKIFFTCILDTDETDEALSGQAVPNFVHEPIPNEKHIENLSI
jgi:hypothetical protein